MENKSSTNTNDPTDHSIHPNKYSDIYQAPIRRDILLEFLTSKAILVAGTLLAVLSTAVAIVNSIHRSMDFQWSGTRLLLHHHDPWAIYLSGDPGHEILMSQIPLYLHELYVLLLPFAFLPFSKAKILWAVCNVCFVLILGWSLARLCELDRLKTWLLFVLVLMSTPFRVTVGNGQNDALVLMCIGLWAFAYTQRQRGLLLGIAYLKYSFPPILVVFLLLRRKWKLLLYSIIPPLIGFAFADVWLSTGWRTLAFDPFRTEIHQTGGFVLGLTDIMSVSEAFLRSLAHTSEWLTRLPYGIAVLVACAIAAYFARNCSEVDGRILLACLLMASLTCFQHMIYDFLVLIFSVAVALKSNASVARNLVMVLIAYFWYLERILDIRRWESNPLILLFHFLALIILIGATYQLRHDTQWSSHWEI